MMANSHKGERAITVEGVEYRLRFSVNAICELEDAINAPIETLGSRLASGQAGVRDIRMLWWAALRDHHAAVDLKATGVVVDTLGLTTAITVIGEVLALAFPPDSGGKKKKPQAPSRGRTSRPKPSPPD